GLRPGPEREERRRHAEDDPARDVERDEEPPQLRLANEADARPHDCAGGRRDERDDREDAKDEHAPLCTRSRVGRGSMEAPMTKPNAPREARETAQANDPLDARHWEEVEEATELLQEGEPMKAIVELRRVLQTSPRN